MKQILAFGMLLMSVLGFGQATPTLQQVTTAGNTTTNEVIFSGQTWIGTKIPSYAPFNINQSTPYMYSAMFAHSDPSIDRRLMFGVFNNNMGIQSAVYSNGNNTHLLLNPGGGNVGIGTTTPTKRLDLASTQGNGIQMRYDASLGYTAGITPYWNSGTDTRMDFAIGNGAAPTTIMSLRAQDATSNSPARMDVIGKIVAGSINSTGGDVILEGRYGQGTANGTIFSMGTMASSGNPYWGYGMKATPYAQYTETNRYLSSTDIQAGGGDVKFFVGDSQKSTDGGAVNIKQAATISNIGIGVGTATPSKRLDLASAQGNGIQMRYDASLGYTAGITPYWNSGTDTRMDFAIGNGAAPTTIMSLRAQDATSNSPARMDVIGKIVAGSINSTGGDVILEGRYGQGTANGTIFSMGTMASSGNPYWGYGMKATPYAQYTETNRYLSSTDIQAGRAAIELGGSSDIKFFVGDSQKSTDGGIVNIKQIVTFSNVGVGIGTTDTKGYKLAIAGDAIAEKVVVKLKTNWPDHVFKPEYKLPSLSIVEQHIKEKGHLQDIPSEKEVNDKGLDLGDMNAKLLQKIEELTLYIIAQEKRIQKLEEQSKKK
jgi:hypothetical protein